jgi:Fe-S-cluster containining protein
MPGDVWATERERRRIAEYLGLTYDDFMEGYVRREGRRYSLEEKGPEDHWDCVFLGHQDGKRVCEIYPVRPAQCRSWPFWSVNLRSRAAWDRAAETCPGMNRGKRHDFVHIEIQRTRAF